MSVRAAVFDLDNCLAAADEVGEALFAPAFDAIRAANKGRLSEPQLSSAFADTWRHALDFVAKKHRSRTRCWTPAGARSARSR